MLMRAATLAALALVALPASTSAEDIFQETFQDGDADGWGSAGEGDVRLTTYADNISMRLSNAVMVFAAVTTEGYDQVSVSAAFAADDLERGEACVFDVSANEGADWIEVLRVGDGRDDALTLHRGSLTDARLDNQARIILRARIAGNSDDDLCWLDNVAITGRWTAEAAAAEAFRMDPAFLNGAGPLPHPVSTSAYAPSPRASAANAVGMGRLRLDPQGGSTIRILLDRFGFAAMPNTAIDTPPVIDTGFVIHGERLLPVRRGLTLTEHPFWDYVLTPGRVWREPGETGWMRAALPFALVEKNANCVHNGLVTFLIGPNGETSRAAWQIGSETCAYFQFDAWGMAAVTLERAQVAGADALKRRDDAERAARLPVRPIEALGQAYPGIDATAFGSPHDVDPAAMTTFGLVVDGVHFTGGCQTRFGAYPYCEEMVLPSYSLAKSLFGGLGLMQLEARHPGAREALIADYVPECAADGDWDAVSFEHALDMATGLYQSTEPDVDEAAAVDADFFLVGSHAQKAALACSRYPRRDAPGQTFVYHTTATYLLGAGMQAFLQDREGPEADIYRDLLVEPVWRALGLSATMDETRRTVDDRAQPFVGWGLVMQRGDLARLLDFLGANEGAIDGRQVLGRAALRAALQRDPSDRGLPAPAPPLGYNDGFWSYDIQRYGGCRQSTPIAFMSGFGGIVGAIIPNGAAYYYVSDAYQFRWARAVMATEAISSFCTGLD